MNRELEKYKEKMFEDIKHVDENGIEYTEWHDRRVLDVHVKNKINDKKRQIEENKRTMDNYKNQVANSI